jgi:myo-inositol-1(or 4)-monophosphatase
LPGADLALLTGAARRAGEIALGYFGKSPETWMKSPEAGPVTEADLAVNAMLRETLGTARPGYGWLSEESEDDPARLAADRCFVVDPIDGTRAFIAGEASWSVSLAVAEAGRIVAAAVYVPVEDLLYAAEAGGGAELNHRPVRVSDRPAEEGARVLATRASFLPELWPGGPPPVDRHFRPSLAWRLALVAQGRYDAMLTLKPAWEWDIAAGALIAAEAGARVTDRRGLEPRFNAPVPQTDGLVVAGPGLHAALMRRLVPSG